MKYIKTAFWATFWAWCFCAIGTFFWHSIIPLWSAWLAFFISYTLRKIYEI